jgi:hypothetical protein
MTIGVAALATSLIGGVLGWILAGAVADEVRDSVGLSESALLAMEDTFRLVEDVASEVDDGLIAAADSIAGAADGAETASERLGDLADFLDSDLTSDLEALQRSMPAAIQAAGAIDSTLSALAFFGVDYDPDEPFDVSLMAVEDALAGLPEELRNQAAAIRALVPTSSQFARDARALSESFTSLGSDLSRSQGVIDSYRSTLEQARSVVEDTDASLRSNTWLVRLVILMLSLTGAILAVGMIMLSRVVSESPARVEEALV